MTSFQERFKGKTSAISKDGVIPAFEKPPSSQSYVQKDYSYQLDRDQTTQNSNASSTNNYSINSYKYGNYSKGSQYANSNLSYSPLSNPYILSGIKTPQINLYQSQKNGSKDTSDIQLNNKQEDSNSNFSTQSQQSNNLKISLAQKINQQNILQNGSYIAQNPFTLEMNSLNNSSRIGYLKQQLSQGIPIPFYENRYNGQVKNSASSQNMQNLIQNNVDLLSNLPSDNTLSNSRIKNRSSNSKYSAYTLENNSKLHQSSSGQSNMTAEPNYLPYRNFNPYTLSSIQNLNQKPGKNIKAASSPDMRRYNDRQKQQQYEQQQNNKQDQELEASLYVSTYVPSFVKPTLTENQETNEELNRSKKNSLGSDYLLALQQKGLFGANVGSLEWNQKREKQDRIIEYSAKVKQQNQQQQSLPPSNQRKPQYNEENNYQSSRSRDQSVDFSKSKQRSKTEKNVTEDSTNPYTKQSDQIIDYTYLDEASPSSNGNTSTIKSNNSGQSGIKNSVRTDVEIFEKQHFTYLNKVDQPKLNS